MWECIFFQEKYVAVRTEESKLQQISASQAALCKVTLFVLHCLVRSNCDYNFYSENLITIFILQSVYQYSILNA